MKEDIIDIIMEIKDIQQDQGKRLIDLIHGLKYTQHRKE